MISCGAMFLTLIAFRAPEIYSPMMEGWRPRFISVTTSAAGVCSANWTMRSRMKSRVPLLLPPQSQYMTLSFWSWNTPRVAMALGVRSILREDNILPNHLILIENDVRIIHVIHIRAFHGFCTVLHVKIDETDETLFRVLWYNRSICGTVPVLCWHWYCTVLGRPPTCSRKAPKIKFCLQRPDR